MLGDKVIFGNEWLENEHSKDSDGKLKPKGKNHKKNGSLMKAHRQEVTKTLDQLAQQGRLIRMSQPKITREEVVRQMRKNRDSLLDKKLNDKSKA